MKKATISFASRIKDRKCLCKNFLTLLLSSTLAGCPYTVVRKPTYPVNLNARSLIAGYLDLRRAFPGVISGVGEILVADSTGIKQLGNLIDCLPYDSRPPIQTSSAEWAAAFKEPVLMSPRAFLLFEHLAPGPRFAEVEAVRIELHDIRREQVTDTTLNYSLQGSAGRLSATCLNTLVDGYYLVSDALYAEHLTYALLGAKGPLNLSQDSIAEYLTGIYSKQAALSSRQFDVKADGRIYKHSKTYIGIGDEKPHHSSELDRNTKSLFEQVDAYCNSNIQTYKTGECL